MLIDMLNPISYQLVEVPIYSNTWHQRRLLLVKMMMKMTVNDKMMINRQLHLLLLRQLVYDNVTILTWAQVHLAPVSMDQLELTGEIMILLTRVAEGRPEKRVNASPVIQSK